MTCPDCGATNADSARFCTECGTGLAAACAACGAPHAAGQRFCADCGARLGEPHTGDAALEAARDEPASERRLVSVLFVDLVGFTGLSESRDAEAVRELLSTYFETARRVIGRYGGTVEKFIGDAVMAVWGAPSATEDDAERAVRAALELVAAVATLGEEVGAPELRARAGVTTGEAAVTLGASGEGMVAGDLVNTASRIQAAAGPGTALVAESTRRATDDTVVYEEAGHHELKGKAEPVTLWRAVRVVSGARGALKSHRLEAPFVGRDRELRQIKDLFHACADEKRAQLVSVTGIAGVGKSRLMWEFYKYFDGLVDDTYWHRGRCLAYGDGVAYWALADMVRMRCRIAEDEEPAPALAKLSATLDEHLLDADERRFIEPHLAQLLGLEEHGGPDRQDLFAAWRLFFERLAETYPTVLAFEDVQWADSSLLDFIEYLLDWSRNHALYVITLARPELLDRRPTWGAGKRNFSSIYLEPLSETSTRELLGGLVPGLPGELSEQILARAEGIPLYAVETVRMLLDRGLLAEEGSAYRPTGEITALEVPQTLHGLIAARLDGLSTDERRLLQDASVLGKTFAREGLVALSGLPPDALEPLLTSLVRKEVLSLQSDPRSPEHGQYGFLQELVRHVAYETLSKRDRRAKHLAVAAYLEAAYPDDDEVVEVVASHYLVAYETVPDADDAEAIKARARDTLARAGARAASLAAAGEAQGYFARAVELADDPRTQAALLEQAGESARAGGDYGTAQEHFERAVALFEAESQTHPAARVSARLGEILYERGLAEEALARMEESFAILRADEPDEDLAMLAAQLGRLHSLLGNDAIALERLEFALDIAEPLDLPEVTSQALNSKALTLKLRPHESGALLREALRIALDHGLTAAAFRAYTNLGWLAQQSSAPIAGWLEALDAGLALARRQGDRGWEWVLLTHLVEYLFAVGDWDGAQARADDIGEKAQLVEAQGAYPYEVLLRMSVERGELAEARRLWTRVEGRQQAAELQDRGFAALARASLRRAEGTHADALAAGEDALATLVRDGNLWNAADGFAEAAAAALALGRLEKAEELLAAHDRLPPAQRIPYADAQAARLRALVDAERGDDAAAAAGFDRAASAFRDVGVPFWLAVTRLQEAEVLASRDRAPDAERLAEAREIFERLGARPWLERIDRVATARLATA